MNEPHLRAALARLLDSSKSRYAPRTRHWTGEGAARRPKYVNHLVLETSPYLLQHAHNPVDWRPWGPEAFAEAKKRGVPVFTSVGYSTCHWCHVMEHESFEDEEIADVLNRHFVAIKVDREERPDVDALFMDYVQHTTGRGGWPMSVFISPDREPLYGGTYFPPRDGARGPYPGFVTILRQINAHWTDPDLVSRSQRVMDAIAEEAARPAVEEMPGPEHLDHASSEYLRIADSEHGGFGGAPKFPRPVALGFLLRAWHRTGNAELLQCVETTLERMACGGIYDHIGGGFARYSVDSEWRVPHFEKMLYDNAQLVIAYLEGYQATGRVFYADVARDVLDYLAREMTAPEGGFCSATDADSDGEEGRFFVWTPAEIDAELTSADADWVRATFDVTPAGNFDGRNVLHLDRPLNDDCRDQWARARQKLYAARAKREPPALDDKIVTAWNGMAISAFARAAVVLDSPRHAERAARAARFVLEALRVDGALARSWRAGRARHRAVLEDYAAMIVACTDLVQATGDSTWLESARTLQATLDAHFSDEANGGYFRTAVDSEPLPVRQKPQYDGAEPSGNAIAVDGLLRLATMTGEADYAQRAAATIRASGALIERAPFAVPMLLSTLEQWHAEAKQVVVVLPEGTDRGAPSVRALLAPLRATFSPHTVLLVDHASGSLARALPTFEHRVSRDDHPTAYVCIGTLCRASCTDPETLAAQLG